MTEIALPKLPVQSLLHFATATPDAPAVICGAVTLSYRAHADHVAACARLLRARGLASGMMVILQSEDRLAHLTLIRACEAIGAATLSVSETDLRLDQGLRESSDLICADLALHDLPCGRAVRLQTAAVMSELRAETAPADLAALAVDPADETVLRLFRTSGTTGRPKLISISAASLRGNIYVQLDGRRISGIGGGYVSVYGLNVGSAYITAACALTLGETMRFLDVATLIAEFDALPDFTTVMVPSEAALIASHRAGQGKAARRAGLHVIGMTLPPTLRANLAAHAVTCVQNTYSLSETGRVAHLDEAGTAETIPGVTVRMLADDGTAVPDGKPGRIAVRSPALFSGYYGAGGGNANLVDGWLVTSDIGVMLSPTRFRVLGRSDDMLNIAGTKLAPDAFEAVLRRLPAVTDAALLSVPDGQGVERLLVMLQMADDSQRQAMPAMVTASLPENLGHVSIVFTGPMPRTESGKLRRAELRESWLRHVQAGVGQAGAGQG